jgi:hypothetical protein
MTTHATPPSLEDRLVDVRLIRNLLGLLLAVLVAWPIATLGADSLSDTSDALRGDLSPVYVEYVPNAEVELSDAEAIRGDYSPVVTEEVAAIGAESDFSVAEAIRGGYSPVTTEEIVALPAEPAVEAASVEEMIRGSLSPIL